MADLTREEVEEILGQLKEHKERIEAEGDMQEDQEEEESPDEEGEAEENEEPATGKEPTEEIA